jgi:hypothetical protein
MPYEADSPDQGKYHSLFRAAGLPYPAGPEDDRQMSSRLADEFITVIVLQKTCPFSKLLPAASALSGRVSTRPLWGDSYLSPIRASSYGGVSFVICWWLYSKQTQRV